MSPIVIPLSSLLRSGAFLENFCEVFSLESQFDEFLILIACLSKILISLWILVLDEALNVLCLIIGISFVIFVGKPIAHTVFLAFLVARQGLNFDSLLIPNLKWNIDPDMFFSTFGDILTAEAEAFSLRSSSDKFSSNSRE
ncbi:unnamed protein product [Moneuplotes crassus]|uniref:Uncharacterized protein n=1 Tax=Euplotes crassus TaxID=5936 RepID=A0AAD1UAS1_EUPCR|nr:unnamed protein product [Moneuplotes crassus]